MVAALVLRLEETVRSHRSGAQTRSISPPLRPNRTIPGWRWRFRDAFTFHRHRTDRRGNAAARPVGVPLVVAHVARRPQSAEAVIASLGMAGLGPASQVSTNLGVTKQPAHPGGASRLVIASPCERPRRCRPLHPSPRSRGPRCPRQSVRDPRSSTTRRLPTRPRPTERTSKASGVVIGSQTWRCRRSRRRLLQTALLGRAARAFLPTLLARFASVMGDYRESRAILALIRGLGADGAGCARACRCSPG